MATKFEKCKRRKPQEKPRVEGAENFNEDERREGVKIISQTENVVKEIIVHVISV